MGCGCSNQSTNQSQIVKKINMLIIDISMSIDLYKNIYKLCSKTHYQNIIKSLILDKNYHIKILKEIYTLLTGEISTLAPASTCTEKRAIIPLINSNIEKEFELIDLLKSLRYDIDDSNLKHAINIILIDQNSIVNKLLYIKSEKK